MLTCPTIEHTKGDVIPLFLKYMTKQHGGMLKSRANDRITVSLQCTLPSCLSSPCMNRGRCSEDLHGFICDCEGEYIGHLCQRMGPTCPEITCFNGGTCYDDPTIGFYCLCDPCFFGEFCEQEYNDKGNSSTYAYEPLLHYVTVPDTYYLGLSQTVNSSNCEIRRSHFIIAWLISAPNGTVPVITIYDFDTYDVEGEEYFLVLSSPLDDVLKNFRDFRIANNLTKPYKDVELWVPGVWTDPDKSNTLLLAQGNLRTVLPFTVRALSNRMFCVFVSSLSGFDIERYTLVAAKVRAVYPDQL